MGSRVVCVLGMHRSGTSLVSGILGKLGFSHGPASSLMPPNEYNPRGYWENQPLVDLNDALLASFGGSWDSPPDFPEGWHQQPDLEPLRERARRILETEFGDEPRWVWKDPRLCLTLPFWMPLIPDMRYLICVRNPLDVARSLQTRDDMTLGAAGDLWLTYTEAAFVATAGLPRMVVHYEQVLEAWAPQVDRLAAFVGASVGKADLAGIPGLDEFVDASLEHHHGDPEEGLSAAAISYPARAAYLLVRALSALVEGQPEDHWATRLRLERVLVAAAEAQRGADLSQRLAESERQARALRTLMAARDAEIAGAHAEVGRLAAGLAQSQSRIEELDTALGVADQALARMAASRSWRLTAPLRWLMSRLRRSVPPR